MCDALQMQCPRVIISKPVTVSLNSPCTQPMCQCTPCMRQVQEAGITPTCKVCSTCALVSSTPLVKVELSNAEQHIHRHVAVLPQLLDQVLRKVGAAGSSAAQDT
jgi:hypothetical protein